MERNKKGDFPSLLLYSLLLLLFIPLTSQTVITNTNISPITSFSYRGLRLGLTKNETMEIISKDPWINLDEKYLLEQINPLLPTSLKAYIVPYVTMYLLFDTNEILSEIILVFDRKEFGMLDILNRLKRKYGEPKKQTAEYAEWSESNTVLLFSFPSTVKVLYTNFYFISPSLKTLERQLKEEILRDL